MLPGPQAPEQASRQPAPRRRPDAHHTPSLPRAPPHPHRCAHSPPDTEHDSRAPGPPAPPGLGGPCCCVASLGPAGGPALTWASGPLCPAQGQTVSGPSRGGQAAGSPTTCQPVWTPGDPRGAQGSGRDLGHCPPSAYSCWAKAGLPCIGSLSLGSGPVWPVQGQELDSWLSPEDLTTAPSPPRRRGQTPYLPASEATLVAGGHLLALKPSTPA